MATTRNQAAADLIKEHPGDELWRFRVSAALGIEREQTVERIRAGVRLLPDLFMELGPNREFKSQLVQLDGLNAILEEAAR